jgi:hypothetical protein
MVISTRRRYLRQHYRYELMLGITFKSIGGYLDACCLRNSITDDGCPVATKCRRWWDRKCDRTPSHLSEAEIVAIIAEFSRVRKGWLESAQASNTGRGRSKASRLGTS